MLPRLDQDGRPQPLVVRRLPGQRFAELRFIADGGEFSVTLSAGIAGTDVNSDAEQLRERADKALYAAKHGGRNQVQVATPEEHRG